MSGVCVLFDGLHRFEGAGKPLQLTVVLHSLCSAYEIICFDPEFGQEASRLYLDGGKLRSGVANRSAEGVESFEKSPMVHILNGLLVEECLCESFEVKCLYEQAIIARPVEITPFPALHTKTSGATSGGAEAGIAGDADTSRPRERNGKRVTMSTEPCEDDTPADPVEVIKPTTFSERVSTSFKTLRQSIALVVNTGETSSLKSQPSFLSRLGSSMKLSPTKEAHIAALRGLLDSHASLDLSTPKPVSHATSVASSEPKWYQHEDNNKAVTPHSTSTSATSTGTTPTVATTKKRRGQSVEVTRRSLLGMFGFELPGDEQNTLKPSNKHSPKQSLKDKDRTCASASATAQPPSLMQGLSYLLSGRTNKVVPTA